MNTINANEALLRLKKGNARFVQNVISLSSLTHNERRENLLSSQSPFAIVLSCSDSRVPSEIVFDQGLGDLFVIRVAGNIVAPSIIGSVEFAASTFGTQLVVVMGHSQCGAIKAALSSEQHGQSTSSPHIKDIVDRIAPSIRPLIKAHEASHHSLSQEHLLDECVRANVISSVNQLEHSSRIIESLVLEKRLMIVGAHYGLDSGKVQFFSNHDDLDEEVPGLKSTHKEQNIYV